ncbi:MAG: hypothetical protein HKL89_09660 [Candidatus Dormibacteraeota bacterium]|nr:hypothetical protein [Candidatus Dormibacteraeota bacterium]
MADVAGDQAAGEDMRDYGGDGPELRIRPAPEQRARAALTAAMWVGLLLLPVGLLMALLARSLVWVGILEGWAVLLAFLSYFGQGHNAVFVGGAGIRRVSRGCNVTAPWAELESLEVSLPGHRIVVIKINSADFQVRKRGRGRSRAADVMQRYVPEAFQFRLDRASADRLVSSIARQRPDLPGITSWERDSRPPATGLDS